MEEPQRKSEGMMIGKLRRGQEVSQDGFLWKIVEIVNISSKCCPRNSISLVREENGKIVKRTETFLCGHVLQIDEHGVPVLK